ncbi:MULTISPECIES: hypothetical protein [Microbacterium]|uniref:hypothetical protein n=1 Tax=Microbacterium TaxID=33882 RepID=UPI0027823F5D|nr:MULTISPECIES: hypothetical protein [Microbacterium]MDQ1082817.1 positive regulator of sigma E activity [Microbacterium sp. SORGH_AS_0344]MDQ1168413.1 positive regulator of sigma E activity [Microbacterium proteolyticum]
MASPRSTPRTLSRGDTGSFLLFMVAGVAIAGWAVVRSIGNIIAAVGNRDVRVPVEFLGTVAQAPIGPGGALVPVQLTDAVVTAPSLPLASLWALFLAEGLFAASVATVVTLLLVLCIGILRGRIFSRRHTRLVAAAGVVSLIGAIGVPFFHNMVANGALAWLSERTYDRGLTQQIDLPVLIVIGFVAGLSSTVFAVGDRLQRDTEGLV